MQFFKTLALRVALGVSLLGAIVLLAQPTKAADKGGVLYPKSAEDIYTPREGVGFRPGCYVEVSGGAGIGMIEAEGLSISDQGAVVGAGGGCDLVAGGLLAGIMGRADWSNVSIQGLGVDPQYTIAGRAGVLVVPRLLIYGLAGWQVTDIDMIGNTQGWLVGLGSEWLLNERVVLGVEATAALYRDELVGETKIDPNSYVVRAKLGWRF